MPYGLPASPIGTKASDLSDVRLPLSTASTNLHPWQLITLAKRTLYLPHTSLVCHTTDLVTSSTMADRVITAASSSKAPGCVPKQSLAATHPSNYGQVARKTMLPPSQMVQNPQISKKTQKAAAVKERRTLRHGYPTPSLSPEATAQDRHGPGRERIMRPDPTSPTLNHSATASVATASQPKAEQQARMPWQMHTDPTVFSASNHTIKHLPLLTGA